MPPSTIISIISVGVAAGSLLFVILNYFKNNGKDHDAEVENKIKVNVLLDQINNTTTSIQADIKAMQSNLSAMDKRITIVERDIKSAFHKIDEIKENMKGE